MIDVNIKKLSRLELIYTCIANLVKRLSKESSVEIPEGLRHYAATNDYKQVFYYAKSSSYAEKCLELLRDVTRSSHSVGTVALAGKNTPSLNGACQNRQL